MAAATPATLEDRVARLRENLHSSPQGRKTMMELFDMGMVQTERDIASGEQGWEQRWTQWLERLQPVGQSLGWDQGWEQTWTQW